MHQIHLISSDSARTPELIISRIALLLGGLGGSRLVVSSLRTWLLLLGVIMRSMSLAAVRITQCGGIIGMDLPGVVGQVSEVNSIYAIDLIQADDSVRCLHFRAKCCLLGSWQN